MLHSLSPMVARLSTLTISLTVLALAQASYAQGARSRYEPPEYHDGQTHYEKTKESFGRFTVVRYVEDCRAVPIMHSVCWLTMQARLEWHDSSGAIGFAFVDNGGSVHFEQQSKSADGQTICIAQGVLVGFDPKPSTIENWNKLQPFINR